MLYILIISLSLLSIGIINYLLNKNKIIIESLSNDERKIHTQEVARVGGLTFLPVILTIFFISDETLKSIILYSYLFLALGLYEDLFNILDKYFRLFIIIILIIIVIDEHSLTINQFNNNILDLIFTNNLFLSFIFSILGLLILINGFNFVDGLNGLLLGITIIIISFYAFNLFGKSDDLFILCLSLISACAVLFFFNFFYGRILTGDGGSYLLGFLVAIISIFVANANILDPLTIACIIYFPAIELIFTFFRRILVEKANPFLPDNSHMHQLIFIILNKKRNDSGKLSNNSLSSLIVLSYILAVVSFSMICVSFFNPLYIFFIINFLYVVTYIKISTYKNSLVNLSSNP